MKLQLPDNVCSPQDVKSIMLEVRAYSKWFGQASVKNQLAIKNSPTPPALSPTAIELIKDSMAGKKISQSGLDEAIDILEEFLDSAPNLTITLAAAPSNGLKQTLVGWCRKNIDPNILVSFKFNSTILGGMVVRYRSQVFDWSFRRQILAERGRFPEVLRNV